MRAFFDEVMEMGVEGIVLSPGYSYEMAPDQNRFLGRARVRRLFRAILSNRKPNWKFNMSPLFLEFLMGDRKYECTPWGSPAYNIFGWQRPCYLLQDGYAESFKELLETTKWEEYGVASGNPKCANCMVSCGYEPSAVMDGFGSLSRLLGHDARNLQAVSTTSTRSTCSTSPRRTARPRWCRSRSPAHALEETERMTAEVHEVHPGTGRSAGTRSRHRARDSWKAGSPRSRATKTCARRSKRPSTIAVT